MDAALGEAGLEPVRSEVVEAKEFGDVIRGAAGTVDTVLVAGGDGSLSAALPALLETKLALGILPMGTANNLARTLGLPTDLAAAARVVGGGRLRHIDIGVANDRVFFTTASLGLSVRITEELSGEAKQRFGMLAYALTTLRLVREARPFHVDIVADGLAVRSRTVQVVVGNGRFYGQGLQVAQDASIDDATLDLYSLEVRHWWRLPLLAPALKRGVQGKKRDVLTLSAHEIELRTRVPHQLDLDGEVAGTTPVTFRVLRRALGVWVTGSSR